MRHCAGMTRLPGHFAKLVMLALLWAARVVAATRREIAVSQSLCRAPGPLTSLIAPHRHPLTACQACLPGLTVGITALLPAFGQTVATTRIVAKIHATAAVSLPQTNAPSALAPPR